MPDPNRQASGLPERTIAARCHLLVTQELVGAPSVGVRSQRRRTMIELTPKQQVWSSRLTEKQRARRFPHNLAGQVPWQEQQAGVYDCRWGLDTIRVIVTGQLRARRTTLRCTCSAPRPNWSALVAASTGSGRKTPARCSGSCSSGLGRRVSPCRSRWRTSSGSTPRNTSHS